MVIFDMHSVLDVCSAVNWMFLERAQQNKKKEKVKEKVEALV